MKRKVVVTKKNTVLTLISDFDVFLDTFEKGGDVLQFAADGKTHIVGQDWFASKLADASIPSTMVEIQHQHTKLPTKKQVRVT
ncbi:hypothetical protein FACS1894199_01830 [Bacteroidia bacterium]|nr:hypothetical protein FACS1894199_01830 [Bacteroidia bacterium]